MPRLEHLKTSFSKMQRVKVVIVGDYEVGKSRFLVQWCSNDFPGSAVYAVVVDGKPVEVVLWDTRTYLTNPKLYDCGLRYYSVK